MKSLIVELQYRFFYTLLTFLFLITLVYFNFGYQVEYFWSYFYHHYQAIEFCWKESLRYDLNSVYFRPDSVTDQESITSVSYKDSRFMSDEILERFQAWIDCRTNRSSEMEYQSIEKLHNPQNSKKTYDYFLENTVITPCYETQQWKPLFLSHLFYFNDHLRLDKVDKLLAGESNPIPTLPWLPFIFYPGICYVGYHIYAFIAPAVLNSGRIFLARMGQLFLCLTILHCYCGFIILQIVEEFSVESIDSELFTKTNLSNQFIDLWLYAFYMNQFCLCFNVIICCFFICKGFRGNFKNT